MAGQETYAVDYMPPWERQLYADTIYNVDKAIRSIVPLMPYRSQEDIDAFYRGVGGDVINESRDPNVLSAQGAYTSALPAALLGILSKGYVRGAPKPDYSNLPEEVRELAQWQDYSTPRKIYELGKQAFKARDDIKDVLVRNYPSLGSISSADLIAGSTAAGVMMRGKGGSVPELTPEENERRYQEAVEKARKRNQAVAAIPATTAVTPIPATAPVATTRNDIATPTPPVNPYAMQYSDEYKAERPLYLQEYNKAYANKDYNTAEKITQLFYDRTKTPRPEYGPGSKRAVAEAFGVNLPESVPATPAVAAPAARAKPAMIPIYETVTKKIKDEKGNIKLIASRVKIGEVLAPTTKEQPTQPGTQLSAVSDSVALEQRMKFIGEMRNELRKQFGFDPFESPHNKAVEYTEKLFREMGAYMPGNYKDMDEFYSKKLKEFTAQQQEALAVLKAGMEMYDAQHGIKMIPNTQYGGLLAQGNRIIGSLPAIQNPVIGERGAVVNGQLYMFPPEQKLVPFGEGGGVAALTPIGIVTAGGAPIPNKHQLNPQTMNAIVSQTYARFTNLANKLGIPPEKIRAAESNAAANSIPPGSYAHLNAVWGPLLTEKGYGKQFAEIMSQISNPYGQATDQAGTQPVAAPAARTGQFRRGSDGYIYTVNGENTGYRWTQ